MSVFDSYAEGLGQVGTLITGSDLNISAQNEIDAWDGYVETDPAVQDRLALYWSNLGENWTNTKHWSAAFVSYLLRNQGFKGNNAHWAYTRDIIAGSSDYPGWKAYNLPWNIYGTGVELNVGDLLVKKRSGSNTSGHADLVYRVDPESGSAYVIGGNMSDSVSSRRIDLMEGRRIGDSDYQIILKRHGGLGKKNQMLWLLAAGGLAWIFLK
jgi:hypothetical protein